MPYLLFAARSLDGSSGNSDRHEVGTKIGYDGRPGADDTRLTDADTGNNGGAGTDEGKWANAYTARQRRSRPDMSGLAYLTVVVGNGVRVDDCQVLDHGGGIDPGTGHDSHPMPEARGGRDDSIRADRVDEFESKRSYSSGHFHPQRVIAKRDEAVPHPLRVEVRQDVVTAQYRGADHVSSLRRGIGAANHLVTALGSDQFHDHFRVAARTDHNYGRERQHVGLKRREQRRSRPNERYVHGENVRQVNLLYWHALSRWFFDHVRLKFLVAEGG